MISFRLTLATLASAILLFIPHATGKESIPGLIRVNSTIQTYNASQPWERNTPGSRRGLGAVMKDQQILTTAEMAANTTYIELESADGSRTTPAKVVAIDYEANLAVLTPEAEGGSDWIKELGTLELNGPVKIGDEVDVWQLEDNGTSLRTEGTVRSVDLLSTFIAGHYFLAYEVKGSMQSASSSYTLPVTRDGKLLGILTSYNSKDQMSDVVAPEIIRSFLEDLADGSYEGFPSLGVSTSLTEDPQFRAWLGLTDTQGGIYLNRVGPGSAAEKAGLQEGDVILKIDGHSIDRRGYYEDELYERLFWSHLVRGMKSVGESLELIILRDQKEQPITATLQRPPKPLIPSHIHDLPPPYLVKGGLVFQELSRSYLSAFGKGWDTRGPLNLLDALRNPKDYEENRNRLVFLSRVVATHATVGYDRINNQIVSEVNGHPVKDMASLAEAFKTPVDGLHQIKIDEVPYVLYLDPQLADQVDEAFKQNGLPQLQRLPVH